MLHVIATAIVVATTTIVVEDATPPRATNDSVHGGSVASL
jgi:hypothetical protein